MKMRVILCKTKTDGIWAFSINNKIIFSPCNMLYAADILSYKVSFNFNCFSD